MRRQTILLCSLALWTCDDSPVEQWSPEFSGCHQVHRDNLCIYSPGSNLNFWLEKPPAGCQWALDSQEVDSQKTPEFSGFIYRIKVPAGHTKLSLECVGETVFQLHLKEKGVEDRWFIKARKLTRAGKYQKAEEILQQQLPKLSESKKNKALSQLARVYLRSGRFKDSVNLLEKTRRNHHLDGNFSQASRDSLAQAFTLGTSLGELSKAKELLEKDPLVTITSEGKARRPYYLALVLRDLGRLRDSLALLRTAWEYATKIEMVHLSRMILQVEADILTHLGEHALAQKRFEDALKISRTPCERVIVLINKGWLSYISMRSGAREAWQQARANMLSCTSHYRANNLNLNLGLEAIQREKPLLAQEYLSAMDEAQKLPPRLKLWNLYAQGQLEALLGKYRSSLKSYLSLQKIDSLSEDIELSWRTLVAISELGPSLGKAGWQEKYLTEAEELLNQSSAKVPLHMGRGAFSLQHSQSAQKLLELLRKQGRFKEAFGVAYHSIARSKYIKRTEIALQSISPEERPEWETAIRNYRKARSELETDAQQDERRSLKQRMHAQKTRREKMSALNADLERALRQITRAPKGMPKPSPDIAEIVIHRLPEGFMVLARRGENIEGAYFRHLSQDLFQPLEVTITEAKAVVLMTDVELERWDLQQFPWRGQALALQKPVLHAQTLHRRGQWRQDKALIVADPQKDLPYAAKEMNWLRKVLPSFPFSSEVLFGHSARREAFLNHLSQVQLLHYAGHIEKDFGWASGLNLADGRFNAGDFLSVHPVPSFVVLSSCDAAAVGERDRSLLSPAQALLSAGAEVVMAPSRPVEDLLAERFVRAFYEHWNKEPDLTAVSSAFWRTQQKIHKEYPDADWPAFRLLTP